MAVIDRPVDTIASEVLPGTRLWWLWVSVVSIISLICDGWSGKPSPVVHQVGLLPITACFGFALWKFLSPATSSRVPAPLSQNVAPSWPSVLLCFQVLSVAMMVAECRHFRGFGYHDPKSTVVVTVCVVVTSWAWVYRSRRPGRLLACVLGTYAAGVIVAIAGFPLNYLRSDMLPVITWADARLVLGLNPYATMHVGNRLYDFPYLPGMLVGFVPAAILHFDPRWVNLGYVAGTAVLIFSATQKQGEARLNVVAALGIFVLCPFVQYRHDLYLSPHWLALALAVTLMQRGTNGIASFCWGVSSAIYQLSWVLLPFACLNAFRRGGLRQAAKEIGLMGLGFLCVAGPFLPFAMHRVASNTVGQWSRLPHALADPMNLSFWLTYLVRPDQLRWIQAAVLTILFVGCLVRGRCSTLTDTLRWMAVALAIFIPLNVLVDGYFYLTLLLLLLMYLCAAAGWWTEPEGRSRLPVRSGLQENAVSPAMTT